MIFISHRGNIDGPQPELENQPDYILIAIDLGFNVEIDVWYVDGKYYLGHEHPDYQISVEFLKNECLWCHLKNLEAVEAVSKEQGIHWFWHETDKLILTSKGFKLTMIGILVPGTIINQPDNCVLLNDNSIYQGFLADNINEFRNKYNEGLSVNQRSNSTNGRRL